MKIGLFYGSSTCYAEMAAEKIQQTFADGAVDIFNIKETPLAECLNYDLIIFGISTWDYGELQEDWESNWQDIAQLDLSEKIVALYGMGDQIGYADWFQDALGLLHQELEAQNAYFIGYWPNQGYEFNQSKALINNDSQFVGLALDEDNQYQLSEQRINTWCQQLKDEINQLLSL